MIFLKDTLLRTFSYQLKKMEVFLSDFKQIKSISRFETLVLCVSAYLSICLSSYIDTDLCKLDLATQTS